MKRTTIRIGFEVGTGEAVDLPLRHMVVTGQTQEAGKTTALEAMIARSGLRALTFVTKRGEGSFGQARRVDPYFREQADWQFVASILEASRGEKLKFERAWIIRASRGARTLADVQRNVRKAMETAKGMSADVYLTLDAYLEAVVPQIEKVKWATSVDLKPGVNVMDMTGLNVEMQHLVIRSSLDWVLNKETDTVVVVPEAWKFIPQGRGTPVKLGAEAFIRQAAGLRNYLWLDSQDIAGVEKLILKSVPVWVLGVQREANEIKNTLKNIPAGIKKPKPEQIATLGLGQFFACHGTHVEKTYVWPAWMEESTALAVAKGETSVEAHPAPAVRSKVEQVIEVKEPSRTKGKDSMSVETKLDTLIELMSRRESGNARDRVPEPAAAPARPSAPKPPSVAAMVEGTSEEDRMYLRFRDRLLVELPTLAAGGTLTVTPPEKLRKDFQSEEVGRIVAAARELKPLAKRVLKLLESTDEHVGQATIAKRLGRSNTGNAAATLSSAIGDLSALGLVEVKNKVGARKATRDKIAADLAFYQATEAEIDAVHQAVLFELATEQTD
jgi:hypothetical protein